MKARDFVLVAFFLLKWLGFLIFHHRAASAAMALALPHWLIAMEKDLFPLATVSFFGRLS